MRKDICRDVNILSTVSIEATKEDINVATDLLDTLKANSNRCVGMAANMIGVNKRIICIDDNGEYVVMLNPKVLKVSSESYVTEEGCLSLDGVREVKRYKSIKVEYTTLEWKKKIKTYEGFSAQIIQHEMDHLEGILI